MTRKNKIVLLIAILVILTSCVLSAIFGIPAIVKQIDAIIASGPGSIITGILGLLFSYYCLVPLLGLIVTAVLIYFAVFKK